MATIAAISNKFHKEFSQEHQNGVVWTLDVTDSSLVKSISYLDCAGYNNISVQVNERSGVAGDIAIGQSNFKGVPATGLFNHTLTPNGASALETSTALLGGFLAVDLTGLTFNATADENKFIVRIVLS